MSRSEYVEITCKTALNRVQGMPFKWSLNPYSGCTHRCVYCYARSHYALAERGDPGRDFGNRIYVKTNFAEVLQRELSRPGWTGELVALGSATDCYQPVEGRYRLTRRTLQALLDRGTPLSLVTKSPLIVRDIDLLATLARVAPVRIFFTVTTLDHGLWRLLEPGTAPPQQRLRAMQRLVEAGVPSGVLLAPVLPGITDSVNGIEAVVRAAAEHRAAFFGSTALRLAPVVREHFLEFLGGSFAHLLPRYQRAYQQTNAPSDYQTRLAERIDQIRQQYGFGDDPRQDRLSGFAPVQSALSTTQPRQLSLSLTAATTRPSR